MKAPARRSSPLFTLIVVALLVLAVVAGWQLYKTGALTLPGGEVVFALERGTKDGPGEPKTGIPCYVAVRAIPAYQKVTGDDLWDPQRQELRVQHLSESLVKERGILSDLGSIRGRVLRHNKSPGFVFTEADFFPKGTRPGIVAGIPPGKRGARVDAGKVSGLVGLNPGDRFDLISTIPIEEESLEALPKLGGFYGPAIELEARIGNYRKQATVRVLVQSGVVVSPLENRQIPVNVSSLTQGPMQRTRVAQEIVIAIEPDEVALLTQALAVEASLTCIPRSGHTDDPIDSLTPDLDPTLPGAKPGLMTGMSTSGPQGLVVVESIRGNQRELVPVPTGSIDEPQAEGSATDDVE